MFNKILRPLAQRALQRGTQKQLSHQDHVAFRDVTFDEATVPQGSWAEANAKRQAKYNAHLIIGIASISLTLGAIFQGELLFFNYLPPEEPKQ